VDNIFAQKKTARTSQKEEEVGELPRATEVTGGRRSFQKSKLIISFHIVNPAYCRFNYFIQIIRQMQEKKYKKKKFFLQK